MGQNDNRFSFYYYYYLCFFALCFCYLVFNSKEPLVVMGIAFV